MTALYRIEEGWACQYRLMKDGRRQITALFLPGDYCEPQWILGGRANLPIVTITQLSAFRLPLDLIPRRPVQDLDSTTNILGAMVRAMTGRERWIVNLGRLSATERICDLICEVFDRLHAVGRAVHNRCAMPLTQYDLADIAGISPVHVNRVLQMLRSAGLIELSNRRLVLRNPGAIRQMSGTPPLAATA